MQVPSIFLISKWICGQLFVSQTELYQYVFNVLNISSDVTDLGEAE